MDHDTSPNPTLTGRLSRCAALWCAAHDDARLERLAFLVLGDRNFFTDKGPLAGPRGPTTATLERFARFLADPDNWPGGAVAKEAAEFAHVTGISAEGADVSPGKTGSDSPARAERAA